MRLDWLEDILAVVETGSFSEAADRRCLTQSAFSRRIKMIEDHIGIELFDRSRKPVQLSAATIAQEPRIRELTLDLQVLINDLRNQSATAQRKITLVAQHAISTSQAPWLIAELSAKAGLNVRLKTASLDDCFAQLLTHTADLALTYRTRTDPIPAKPDIFETVDLGQDVLIAVAKPGYSPDVLGLVSYPKDVHLGQICERDLLPGLEVERTVETGLSHAALELARAGVGFAWVPQSMAQAALDRQELEWRRDLPSIELKLSATRMAVTPSPAEAAAWELIRVRSQ